MRRAFLTPTIATLIACVGVPVLQAQVAEAAADVAPLPTLAYQGRLLEGTTAVSGVRSFTFSILDSTSTELWNSGAQTLTVSEGLYSVVLGATGMPTLPAATLGKAGLKLHVTVSGQALAPDVDIVPAFQAISAWALAGSFSGDLGGTQNQTLVLIQPKRANIPKLKAKETKRRLRICLHLKWPSSCARTASTSPGLSFSISVSKKTIRFAFPMPAKNALPCALRLLPSMTNKPWLAKSQRVSKASIWVLNGPSSKA